MKAQYIIAFLLLSVMFYQSNAFTDDVILLAYCYPDTTKIDSLRVPNNYYYLTDLPLKQVAELFLEDSISPSDNQITFNCMDSISNENSETRNYYFPVFLKIQDKSDAALAEVIGGFLIIYIEKYPWEFSIRINSLSNEQVKSLAYHVGYELYFENDNVNSSKKWFTSVLNKCTDCNQQQIKQIETFNNFVLQSIIENNKTDE